MKRREFMAGSAAGVAGLRARDASASTLLPCINQVTTLGAAFDKECSASWALTRSDPGLLARIDPPPVGLPAE